MAKITGSKFDMYDESDEKAVTYRDCVASVLDNEEVTKLGGYKHHHFTTRLQHSMNVSYYSYSVCKFLGWDYRSAARAGLMHDLYFFENTSVDENGRKLLEDHPFKALENSERLFELNDIERDAIVNHMWPIQCISRPRFKESMAVSFSDKFCAVMEATSGASCFVAKKAALKVEDMRYAAVRRKRNAFTRFNVMYGTATNALKVAWNFIV